MRRAYPEDRGKSTAIAPRSKAAHADEIGKREQK